MKHTLHNERILQVYPTNQRADDSFNNDHKHFDKDCDSWVTGTAYDAKTAAEKKG